MNWIVWLVDCGVLATVGYVVAERPRDLIPAERLALAWLTVFTLLVVSAYSLSIFTVLGCWWCWLLLHVICLTILWLLVKPTWSDGRIWLPIQSFWRGIRAVWRELPLWIRIPIAAYSAVMAAVVIPIILLRIPVHVDSFTYHIPRSLQYFFNGNFDVYPTADERKTDLPFVYEISIVWALAFTQDFRAALFFQGISFLAGACGLYAAARRIGADSIPAIGAALLWLCTPLLVRDATALKNDMILAVYLLVGFPFLLQIRTRFTLTSVILAVVCGLGIGTKYTAGLIVPGLLGAGVYLLWDDENRGQKTLRLTLLICGSCLLLGSYAYVERAVRLGKPIPENDAAQPPHPYALSINSLRLFCTMTDSIYLPMETIGRATGVSWPDPRKPLVDRLSRIPFLNVYSDIGFKTSDEPDAQFRLERHYFQFTLGHFYLLMVGLIVALVRWRTREVKAVVTIVAVSLVIQLGVLKWQIFDCFRFYFPILSLLYPLMACTFAPVCRVCRILLLVAGISVSAGILAMGFYLFLFLQTYRQDGMPSVYSKWIHISAAEVKCYEYARLLPAGTVIGIEKDALVSWAPVSGDRLERKTVLLDNISNWPVAAQIFLDRPELGMILCKNRMETPSNNTDEFYVEKVSDQHIALIRIVDPNAGFYKTPTR